MRSLVTGAAGFLGSHLTERLLAEGHTVIGVDNFCTGLSENLQEALRHPRFSFQELDVFQPFDPGPVDFVFNFASPASPPEYLKLGLETLRVGSYGTENALRVALQHGAAFVQASTSECYGEPLIHPQREDYWGNVNPIGPRSVYDEAKRYSEALVMAYHRYHGVRTRIVRIFNTYGPRLRPADGRVISNFMTQALQGHDLTVYGDGAQTRSFCYVDDLIEGIYRLSQIDESYPVNIGNPAEITILECAQAILKLTRSSSQIRYEDLPQDDPSRRRPDITRAKTLLGWEPQVSLEDGLKRSLDYFKTHLPAAKTHEGC